MWQRLAEADGVDKLCGAPVAFLECLDFGFGEFLERLVGHAASSRSRLAISRAMYRAALRRSSIALPFSSARQTYLTALPGVRPMCSTTWMDSIPALASQSCGAAGLLG